MRRAALWLLLVVAAGSFYGTLLASRVPAGQLLLSRATNRLVAASAALGLVVTNIEVEGRETTDALTVVAALSAARGTPILAISPSRAKQQLEALPWVRSAIIERRLPGTLFVRLTERHPLALWQHEGIQQLIDRDGTVIPVEDLGRFAKLPIVVGDDAAIHAAALIDVLASEPELGARVTAAIRIGERRWNLRIDDAVDVLLPEEKPDLAWHQLAELERSSNLLKRDVQTVDLRLPDRLVLRVTGAPAPQAAPAKKAHAGKPA
ncbi:MAG: FtsQ-type POTRA domain-containing protein [Alphaproteobacteria bacterium]|nr:FtsQ-type POTRA domain-containing protein [Alphaproteobacteria bacterium]